MEVLILVNIISTLVSISLYPFTSGTYFVTVPVVMICVSSLLGFTVRLVRGKM